MSSFAAGALVIGLLVLIGVPVLWLIFRSGAPSPGDREAATREFEHQLRNPDFAALEARLGCQLPAAVASLYADRDLLLGQDWEIDLANPGQRGSESYVAYFQPGVIASLRDLGDGRAEWLAFGNDGAGDEYLVHLRRADAPVVYLQHDTGRAFELTATLAEFLRAPRRQLPAE